MTQKEFAAAANLSESMVSRIIRDRHGKGNTYKVDGDLIDQLALVMKLGIEGRNELRNIASSRNLIIEECLKNGKTVHETNILLEEHGLHLLGEKNIIK